MMEIFLKKLLVKMHKLASWFQKMMYLHKKVL